MGLYRHYWGVLIQQNDITIGLPDEKRSDDECAQPHMQVTAAARRG